MSEAISCQRRLWFWLQFFVTIVASLYLVFAIDWDSLWRVIQGGLLFKLWPGPVLTLLGLALAAFRWTQLLSLYSINLQTRQAFLLYLTATFYGVVLPGVLGGDAVRVSLCSRRTQVPVVKVLSSVLLERVFGLVAVLCLGVTGTLLLLVNTETAVSQNIILWFVPAVTSGLICSICILQWAGPSIKQVLSQAEWLSHALTFLNQLIYLCMKVNTRQAWRTLFVSGLFQLTEISIYYIFSEALGLDVPFKYFLLIIPIVYLATVLPISLGGLGVRESTVVFLLSSFSIDATQAATLAILVYFNRLIVAAISGIVTNINYWLSISRT